MILALLIIELVLLILLIAAQVYIGIQFYRIQIGDVPFVKSRPDMIRVLLDAEVFPKQGMIIDLGCGDGIVLRSLAKAGYTGPLIGIERGLLQILMARFFSRQLKDCIHLKRTRFELADLRQADAIYIYLYPDLVNQLAPRFEQELKKGALVVSASFPINSWTPSRVLRAKGLKNSLTDIYVYER